MPARGHEFYFELNTRRQNSYPQADMQYSFLYRNSKIKESDFKNFPKISDFANSPTTVRSSYEYFRSFSEAFRTYLITEGVPNISEQSSRMFDHKEINLGSSSTSSTIKRSKFRNTYNVIDIFKDDRHLINHVFT